MSLSFNVTRPAAALWWAIAWRTAVMALLLLVPTVAVVFVIQLPMVFGVPLAYMLSPYAGLALTVLFVLVNLALQWFIIPVVTYAFAFRWLFRKGAFGKHAIMGSYRGTQATTLRTALNFSLWFFLENFKYTWPLLLGFASLGLLVDESGRAPANFAFIMLAFIPLGIYVHMLVLTDLIRRRRFSRLELLVTPRKAAATQPQTPVMVAEKPAKPAPKAVVAAKPAAKPVSKAVSKPAAKAKPVAKAKPAAKAKPKPKAKK